MWGCGQLPGENGPGGVKIFSRNQLVQDQDPANQRPGRSTRPCPGGRQPDGACLRFLLLWLPR